VSGSSQIFDRAVSLHREGRLDAAGALYREVLAADPDHVEALHLAGVLAMRSGDMDAGIALFERAVRANPVHSAALLSLARALTQAGQRDAALSTYERVLAVEQNFAQAHYELGNACMVFKEPEAALGHYDRFLALEPGHAAAWSNRGNALQDLERYREAAESYDRALTLQPGNASAIFNRGNALRALGQKEAALASYDRALQLDSRLAEAHYGRGVLLRALNRKQEALLAFERAVALKPRFVDALVNQVGTLDDLGRRGEVGPPLEQLLQVDPDYDNAFGRLLLCRLDSADWRDYARHAVRVDSGLSAGQRVIDPFQALAVCSSAAKQLRAAELHAAGMAPGAITPLLPRHSRKPGKIRLAYVSADFREHAASFLLAGVFEHHDRERFETFAISLLPREPSAIGARVAAAFDRFIEVWGQSDAQIVSLLRELDIDVAVDLMGYTARSQPGIFAQRAAPVQVNYLGFPGTLGSPAIDYLVADSFLVPRELTHHYSEAIVYLPECFQANDDRCVIGPTPTRASVGLPEGAPVLCCFNSNFKVNPPVFDAWMQILRDTPGSVLWLLGESTVLQGNLRKEAAARGVEPARLVFSGKCSYDAHLGRLGLADLFLDTTPYNAGATASDALRVGVPVLTWTGEPLASRMAGSLLRAVGLEELITRSAADYVRKAVDLLSRPERLAELRARLAVNLRTTPLYNTARFCRHLEAAYIGMHERALRGEPPQGFAVPLESR
jgi:protein O-GlcNAc transferase